MRTSALKEYVVLRVDRGEDFHRELVAESDLEGEAVRVAGMLSEVAKIRPSAGFADALLLVSRHVATPVELHAAAIK